MFSEQILMKYDIEIIWIEYVKQSLFLDVQEGIVGHEGSHNEQPEYVPYRRDEVPLDPEFTQKY